MRFHKYHGAGNDFVMLVDLEGALGPHSSLERDAVAAICDRHTGVGADGIIRVMRDAQAPLRMDYYNADGGVSEMCGNGIRCLVVLAAKLAVIGRGENIVMTLAGPRTTVLDAGSVSVDMGVPAMQRERVPMKGTGQSLRASVDGLVGAGVSMGNPHFVIFTDETPAVLADVGTLGPSLETHPDFPERTNVEVVEVLSEDRIAMRVWERGVGETLACGSGACAAGVASAALGKTKRALEVQLRGGVLGIEWREDDHVWLTGPAEEVFAGELGETLSGGLRR
jgi:diaminopimelate epimerase